jgi:hypothetical protein
LPHSEFLAWSKDDRDKALWQYARARETCTSCGTRKAEWLESEGGSRTAYEAVVDRCPGCEQVEYKRTTIDDKKAGKGTFVKLVRGGR